MPEMPGWLELVVLVVLPAVTAAWAKLDERKKRRGEVQASKVDTALAVAEAAKASAERAIIEQNLRTFAAAGKSAEEFVETFDWPNPPRGWPGHVPPRED